MKNTVSKPGRMLTYHQQELNAINTLTTLLVRRSLTSDVDTAVELPVRHAVVPPDSNHLAMPGALLLPPSLVPLPASFTLPLLALHILGVPTQNQNNKQLSFFFD